MEREVSLNKPITVAELDSDVHITYEDQQKINRFARCNARHGDIKEELKIKENDLQNLQDAEDEMMIALDSDEKVPFMVGEVFIMKSQEESQEAIGAQRETLQEEISALNGRSSELQDTMTQLKGDLYAKFGNNINLEPEEE
ncbi:prefoldin subunit 4-like isoform X2 [Portunus trituberculatus]|uniref:prefoldin subunit 4-like isoform X2 n=1 Tax=Portunus trituberculatus TaxID=210409 RepID=UPI001E1CFE6C|nr:prefoldin subunit 4-like isoform X2 [Portunus trituberculatus]